MTTDATVAVVIVNYNTGHLIAQNIDKIFTGLENPELMNVVIVDNKSPDDSVPTLRKMISEHQRSEQIYLIESEKNGGFAAGNNLAIRTIRGSSEINTPDYFYFLNPDAYPKAKAFDIVINLSKKYQDKAIIGSNIINEDGSHRASAFKFPTVVSEFNRGLQLGLINKLFKKSNLVIPLNKEVIECDWVSGAGFLVSDTWLNTIGMMDEKYFLYYEEVDFMKKSKSFNSAMMVATKSEIIHIAGASTGIVQNSAKKDIPKYWYDSWNRFFFKNYSRPVAIMAGISWVIGRVLNNILGIILPERKINDGHKIKNFICYAILGSKNER